MSFDKTVNFNFKIAAFTGERSRENEFNVEPDGTIRVWDSVANMFTLCHGLSDKGCDLVRAEAEKVAARLKKTYSKPEVDC